MIAKIQEVWVWRVATAVFLISTIFFMMLSLAIFAHKTATELPGREQLMDQCAHDWIEAYPRLARDDNAPEKGLAAMPSCQLLTDEEFNDVQREMQEFITATVLG